VIGAGSAGYPVLLSAIGMRGFPARGVLSMLRAAQRPGATKSKQIFEAADTRDYCFKWRSLQDVLTVPVLASKMARTYRRWFRSVLYAVSI